LFQNLPTMVGGFLPEANFSTSYGIIHIMK